MPFAQSDQERIKQRVVEDAPQRGGGGGPAVFMEIKKGRKHTLRLCPPWTNEGPSAGLPFKLIWQHWNVGPDNKRVVCPDKMTEGAQPCFVCQQIKALYQTKDPDDEARAKLMRASKRFVYQVIDREDAIWQPGDQGVERNPDVIGKPKIKFLSLAFTPHKTLADYMTSAEWGLIDDPYKGVDFEIERQGEKLNTTYPIIMKRNPSPLFSKNDDGKTPDEERIELASSLCNDLDTHPLATIPSYETTKNIFLGISEEPPAQLASHSRAALPPAMGKPNMAAWEQRLEKGEILQKEEVLGVFPSLTEEDIPWCYAKEPAPTSEYCANCDLLPHCGRTFRAATGLSYYGGPALTESAPKSSAGKPMGKPMPSTKDFAAQVFKPHS